MKKIFNTLLVILVILVGKANAQDWSEVVKSSASDSKEHDNYGCSVSISGNYAIVGAYQEDEDASGGNTLTDAGSAYILKSDASGNWSEIQKIVASDRGTGDKFGYSVSINGDYVVVGAYDNNSAYIFKNNGSGNWSEIQKIVASDAAMYDRFGWSVSINGDYVIVGAYAEDEDVNGVNTFSSAGSSYIFKNDGADNWMEIQKIVASDRAENKRFGHSVSIDGDYAIVGAHYNKQCLYL